MMPVEMILRFFPKANRGVLTALLVLVAAITQWLSVPASGQICGNTLVWAKKAGGISFDYGRDIAVLSDGTCLITGSFRDTATFGPGEPGETALSEAGGYSHIFVARYNADGTLAWARKAGGAPAWNEGRSIAALADGSSLVTGEFRYWAIFGPGEAGQTTLYASGGYDIFVARYNPDGTLAWAKKAGGSDHESGRGIAVLADGSSLVTGSFSGTATFGPGETGETPLTSSGNLDIFVARYNPDGTLAWAKKAGGTDPDYGDNGQAIAVLADGSALVTGSFAGTATFGPGEPGESSLSSTRLHDIFVARYSPDGTLAWVKKAGGRYYDRGQGIAVLPGGRALVTGGFQGRATFGPGEPGRTSLSSSGGFDIFVAKYNADGAVAWAKKAGGTSGDYGDGIAVLADRSSLVTGRFEGTATFGPGESGQTSLTSSGGYDIFVARYNADGTLAWAKKAGGTDWDEGCAVAVLSDGSALITGAFSGTATFGPGEPGRTALTASGDRDIFVARYSPSQDDPTLRCTTHPDFCEFYRNNTPHYEWDSVAEADYWYYVWDRDPGTQVNEGGTQLPGSQTDLTLPAQGDGSWYFHLAYYNSSTFSMSETRTRQVNIDTVPAWLTSDTHPNEELWYSNPSPHFLWEAVPGSQGSFYVFDQNPGTLIATPAQGTELAGGINTLTVGPASDGTWYFHLANKSVDGNPSASTLHRAARVDTEASPPSSLHHSASLYPSGWTRDTSVTWSWLEPDDLTGIQRYYYVLDAAADTQPTTASASITDTSLAFSDLDDGTWYFHIASQDNAVPPNLSSAAASSVRIDTTPPNPVTSLWAVDESVGTSWCARVYWTDPGDGNGSGVSRYHLYRSSVPGELGSLLTTVDGVTNYLDCGAGSGYPRGFTIYYTVQPEDGVALVQDVGNIQYTHEFGKPTPTPTNTPTNTPTSTYTPTLTSTPTNTFTPTQTPTNAPPIVSLDIEPAQGPPGMTADLTAWAHDPDGLLHHYGWNLAGTGIPDASVPIAQATISSATSQFYLFPGVYPVSFHAWDNEGARASAARSVVVWTLTPTPTNTLTPTHTPTFTETSTPTNTYTVTPTFTPTLTPTPTPTSENTFTEDDLAPTGWSVQRYWHFEGWLHVCEETSFNLRVLNGVGSTVALYRPDGSLYGQWNPNLTGVWQSHYVNSVNQAGYWRVTVTADYAASGYLDSDLYDRVIYAAPPGDRSTFEHFVRVEPCRQNTVKAEPQSYTVRVVNYGSQSRTYSLSLESFVQLQWAFSSSTITLIPGQEGSVELSVTVPSSYPPTSAVVPFAVVVQNGGQRRRGGASIIVEPNAIHDLLPECGTALADDSVTFSWRTTAESTCTLYLSEGCSGSYRAYQTGPGREHVIRLPELTRGTSYCFYVEAFSEAGNVRAPGIGTCRITIESGVRFMDDPYEFTIRRDYNQLRVITVENIDDDSHTFYLTLNEPYDDIQVGFIGDGNEANPIQIGPGEQYNVVLAMHAPDAFEPTYNFIATLRSADPEVRTDYANITIHVDFPAILFTLEELSTEPYTLAKSLRLRNWGEALTDLGIVASEEIADVVLFQPNVSHGYVAEGAPGNPRDFTFQAIPDLSIFLDDPGHAHSGFIRATASGETVELPVDFLCADGRDLYETERRNMIVARMADQHCINNPRFASTFNLPTGFTVNDILGAYLILDFSPQTPNPGRQSIVICLNGQEIGRLTNVVLSGRYQFEIPTGADTPLILPAQGVAQNRIEFTVERLSGGTFVLAAGFEVHIYLEGVDIVLCATSQDEADRYGLPPDYFVLTPDSWDFTSVALRHCQGGEIAEGAEVEIGSCVEIEANLVEQETQLYVSAEFSNGDAALELEPTEGGTYTGTWRPTSYPGYPQDCLVTLYSGAAHNATATRRVRLVAGPPDADFRGVPREGPAPLTVQFTDTSTGLNLSAWEWNFGDDSGSTGQNPAHAFQSPGRYNVSLTVTGDGGQDTAAVPQYIVVNTPRPTPTSPPWPTPTPTRTPAASPTPTPIPFDVDCDGFIGSPDLLNFLQGWHQSAEQQPYLDLDDSGRVDYADVCTVSTQWTPPDIVETVTLLPNTSPTTSDSIIVRLEGTFPGSNYTLLSHWAWVGQPDPYGITPIVVGISFAKPCNEPVEGEPVAFTPIEETLGQLPAGQYRLIVVPNGTEQMELPFTVSAIGASGGRKER